jgi:dTDP-L-rhamnose 4-epimerase
MTTLVTGGAGFIGSHLVDELLVKGENIKILDALVPQVHGERADWPVWTPDGVEKMRGDVRDPEVWRKALQGVDQVYHLAAEVGVGQSMYEIIRYMDANTMGTAHLLEILAQGDHKIEKLVVASSMSIYGEGAYQTAHGEFMFPAEREQEKIARREWEMTIPGEAEPLTPVPTSEDKPLRPTSIYAISKRDQEEMCLSVGKAYHIPTTALRFFNVYGPRQALSNPYTGVAAIFSSRLLNGKQPLIFEDGLQSRDFVHVKDIVQALILAMECETANYEAINIGGGRSTSVRKVAEVLAEKLEVSIEPQIVNKFRAGDIRHCFADISKAERLMGYRPKISFEDGMGDLIAWLRQQTAEDRVDSAAAELENRGLTF